MRTPCDHKFPCVTLNSPGPLHQMIWPILTSAIVASSCHCDLFLVVVASSLLSQPSPSSKNQPSLSVPPVLTTASTSSHRNVASMVSGNSFRNLEYVPGDGAPSSLLEFSLRGHFTTKSTCPADPPWLMDSWTRAKLPDLQARTFFRSL